MKKGRPKGTTGKARVLTKNEIEIAISRVKFNPNYGKHKLRDSSLLASSYYLGLRAKELAGLKFKNIIDLNNEVVTTLDLTITKNSKARTIYIPEALRVILAEFINSYTYSPRPNEALFKSQKGTAFSPNTLQCLLKRIYVKCALENCSSHTGRRSFATRLIEEGADIKAVSSLMGHSSINMTANYVEDNPHRLAKMVNKFL
jgi:integrase/recombinase XerD